MIMIAKCGAYSKTHQTVYFKEINFTVCELYLDLFKKKVLKKKKAGIRCPLSTCHLDSLAYNNVLLFKL